MLTCFKQSNSGSGHVSEPERWKKKKSSEEDGVSQECLLIWIKILVIPLTRIINTSIIRGILPAKWKISIVTPILKKGDPTLKTNYRPVSCLAAASKVLDKITAWSLPKAAITSKLNDNHQTWANNLTWSPYAKNTWYSAIIFVCTFSRH